MTFLLPGFLWAAAAVSLGVIALHFLVTRQPKSDLLPTVRFFPDVPARSTTVAIRPSDLLLLLARVLTIMLIGAAFAQPQRKPRHAAVARVVAVDVSRAVRAPAELADSTRKYTADAAAVVWFDSAASEIAPGAAGDSLAALTAGARPQRRGALSSALIAMLRAASRVREQGDSLELVVVSPFAEEERDGATAQVRALFPGHLRAVQVAAASDSVATQPPRLEWPDSGVVAGWTARPAPDTVGAVRVGDAVMVYPFVRRWRWAADGPAVRVSARWVDGEPAAVETVDGGQCARSVGFALPSGGDAILRPDYARLVDALHAPCGGMQHLRPMPPEALSALEGPATLAPASAVKSRVTRMTPLVPWLLGGALLLVLFELAVRRWSGSGTERQQIEAATPRSAARTTA